MTNSTQSPQHSGSPRRQSRAPRRRRVPAALGGAAAAVAFGAAAGCLATALPGTAAAASAPSRSSQTAQLAALAQQEVAAGAPGVIASVSDGNGSAIQIARQASWTKADGTLTANDQFRMGSNTKTMVATVIMQLVAEHRLALTDPVAKWLPGLIPDGQAITIRMLLNHTSGLFDYLQDPAVLKAFTGRDTRAWTPLQLLAAGVSHKPLFAPGKEYSYSNTNYLALGLVAQKVTGQSLAELIKQRIIEPLGLKSTYLVTGFPAPDDARLANGYEPDAARLAPLLPPYAAPGTSFAGPARGPWADTTWVNTSTEWAAGGMVSTPADWARFQSALLSGPLTAPGPAEGDGDHRLRGRRYAGPVRAGPGEDRHAVRHRLGPHRRGPRLLQLGLHRRHRPAHRVGDRHHHLRYRYAEGGRRHPDPDQRRGLHHVRQARPRRGHHRMRRRPRRCRGLPNGVRGRRS